MGQEGGISHKLAPRVSQLFKFAVTYLRDTLAYFVNGDTPQKPNKMMSPISVRVLYAHVRRHILKEGSRKNHRINVQRQGLTPLRTRVD